MAYELTDLKKAIDMLETKLNGADLAPFKIKLEFSLLQIHTALKVLIGIQSSTADNHNKYLLYKQLETTINDIQIRIQNDSRNHAIVKSLAKSSAFLALATAKPFLISQQKEWLPHYLERDLQTSFDTKDNKNKIESLCSIINNINANSTLSGEQKTKKIEDEIVKFTESKSKDASFSFALFKPRDHLKSDIKAWWATHKQALIEPLFSLSSVSTSSLKNSNNQ